MKIKKQAKILVWLRKICLLGAVVVLAIPAGAVGEEAMPCQRNSHSHTDACYSETGRQLCAYADYLVHTHDGLCYDGGGDLRCSLPEINTHTHEDSCYGPVEADAQQPILWRQVLLCTAAEIRLHTHEDSCFRDGKWICGQWQVLAHRHSAECFSEETASDTAFDWLGVGQVKASPFTIAALLQIAVGMGLLYLQTRWERENMSIATK